MHTINQPELPQILWIEDLSSLIDKTATTIRTCATNQKYAHLIPRPFKLPNSRRLCWYREDVLAWMSGATSVQPSKKPVTRPGPPTKAERIAAQKAGMSVSEWRARQTTGVWPYSHTPVGGRS